MKRIHRLTATLLLLAMLASCAPSDTAVSDEPTESPSPETVTVSDFDYRRYTNPQNAFYPEWAQPYSVYKYDKQEGESVQGKFSLGGYLTKEQLAKDSAKMEHFMDYKYMTPATMYTMISYGEDGHIMLDSLLYRYLNGSYHKEPPTEEEKPQPYEPPKDPSSPFTSSPSTVLPRSEDDIKLSYEEYFSIPRGVDYWFGGLRTLDDQSRNWAKKSAEEYGIDWHIELIEDGTIVSQYFEYAEYSEYYYGIGNPTRVYYTDGDAIYVRDYIEGSEAETLYTAENSRVISIDGNAVVLFFMAADYDVYRLHLPSGTVDYMCNTAFDFEAAHEYHREFRNIEDWQRRTWGAENVGDEEEIARLETIPYEEWDAEKAAREEEYGEGYYWYWADEENDRLPDSGYFEVLSNNDVRFTVLAPDWESTKWEWEPSDWFSNTVIGSGSYFYGDYVIYSAALGKFGATERALDLLNIPQEQRMTFEEFCDYYGGYPPHSGI